MSYTKEERDEEMETELREDLMIERANEYDDGDYETWKTMNISEMVETFLEEHKDSFEEYCKELWKQEKE